MTHHMQSVLERDLPPATGERPAYEEAEEAGKQLSYFFWPCLNEDLYR